MDSPRRRAALNGVDKQDNLCFFKAMKQIEAAVRQLQKFASTVTSRLEAADNFEPRIIVGGKRTAATDHQQSTG